MGEPWRILEFYSGIGGMRYSLMRAGVHAEVIEAFDINDTANDVYEHNFGHRPFQGNIQSLATLELDKYAAHAWLLSPPCQPYTRQGLQKDLADARAFSFIKILELIPHMKQPPQMLFVENVVGFETSNTHKKMLEVFANIGFVTQEFILSPVQFGIPYSRPRYFCLAKRKPLSFQNPSFDNQLLWAPSPLLALKNTVPKDDGHHLQDGILEESLVSCEPVRNFLETHPMYNHQFEHPQLDFCWEHDVSLGDSINHTSAKCFDYEDMQNIYANAEKSDVKVDRGGADEGALDVYTVPQSLIDRWGSAMDIVYPDSTRCCCFTKSYYRYVKGTGSLLATSEFFNHKSAEKPGLCSFKELGLRFFTPREVANLHSFPEDFQFPPHVTVRQRYALLGNSLSIAVVASLFQYLFAEPS